MCSSVGRVSDPLAADIGPILRCGKGFFSQGHLSVQNLSRVFRTPLNATACINMCAHVKDLVVRVRVLWIVETQNNSACTVGCVARLCRS